MKSLKKRIIPLVCRFLLKPKSFSEVPAYVRRVYCKDGDVKILTDTSNNVHVVRCDGKTMFFRECKRHLPLAQYVLESIDLYYTHVVKDLYGDRCFLETCLRDKNRLKTFANMGMTNDLNSGAYWFCMGQGTQHIGLPAVDPLREERLKDLVQYIWGDLFNYSLNSGVETGHFQTYNAVRSISTYRMAQLVGVEDMIPKTEYVLLCIEGREPVFGTMMDGADGVCMEALSCEERQGVSSPALQRALNQLNLLDVLNLEKDHRTGNYHVVVSQGKATNVIAFDNDSPNSFSFGGISFSTYMGCSPWCKDGKVNRPYIDKELADRILSLNEKQVKSRLRDILNPLQLASLNRRIKQVKELLHGTPAPVFLTEEEWTEETVVQELSGSWGMTYLQQFLGEQKLMEQPWIKGRSPSK